MSMMHPNDQAAGTVGGTLIAFIGIVDGNDIIKTAILACVGALVSFWVSKGMQLMWGGEHPSQPSLKKEGANLGKLPDDSASDRGRSDEQK